MPLKLAVGIRETIAWHRLDAPEGGYLRPFPMPPRGRGGGGALPWCQRRPRNFFLEWPWSCSGKVRCGSSGMGRGGGHLVILPPGGWGLDRRMFRGRLSMGAEAGGTIGLGPWCRHLGIPPLPPPPPAPFSLALRPLMNWVTQGNIWDAMTWTNVSRGPPAAQKPFLIPLLQFCSSGGGGGASPPPPQGLA